VEDNVVQKGCYLSTMPMNAEVMTTRVADGIAVITLGSARRIYFDEEMSDALTDALDGFAGDANIRVVVVTGGAPGYFIRHFLVAALIRLAESLRAFGREWPENATYNGGFLDKAMALCVGVNGRWVTFGGLTGAEVKLNIQSLYRKQIKLIGSNGSTRKEFEDVIGMAKELKVRVWKRFKLEDVKEALQALFAKERDGRILLDINSNI
jgi:threonine dehydrogenase-like Zn-dependent dehydrogenase